MDKLKLKITDIDAYHKSCPDHLKNALEQLRHTIKQAAPMATETISYGMPAFKQNKVLVYYAAYKHHIGFYPTPKPIVHFKEELKKYNTSKGAIQFPIDKPLPLTLIKKIVKFRAEEDKDTSKPKPVKQAKAQQISQDILHYNSLQNATDKLNCDLLLKEICKGLPKAENKVWHGHPVWFIDGNPIVG
jgi:uncharacterized protein YdhG (YjbR/CyaY superfamily)